MVYATHADLEDKMAVPDFGTSSIPTAEQVDAMLIELGAMWDGLSHQAEGVETPDEFVIQAVLAAGMYQVNQIRLGEPIDQQVQINLMKQFLASPTSQLFFDQQYPKITGEW